MGTSILMIPGTILVDITLNYNTMTVNDKFKVYFRHAPFENRRKKKQDRWTECSINELIPKYMQVEGNLDRPERLIAYGRSAAHGGDPFCRNTGIFLSFKKAMSVVDADGYPIFTRSEKTELWTEFLKHHSINVNHLKLIQNGNGIRKDNPGKVEGSSGKEGTAIAGKDLFVVQHPEGMSSHGVHL